MSYIKQTASIEWIDGKPYRKTVSDSGKLSFTPVEMFKLPGSDDAARTAILNNSNGEVQTFPAIMRLALKHADAIRAAHPFPTGTGDDEASAEQLREGRREASKTFKAILTNVYGIDAKRQKSSTIRTYVALAANALWSGVKVEPTDDGLIPGPTVLRTSVQLDDDASRARKAESAVRAFASLLEACVGDTSMAQTALATAIASQNPERGAYVSAEDFAAMAPGTTAHGKIKRAA